MKLAGVSAKQKKKFKVTTDSKHNLPVAPNLLNREFEVAAPDQVYRPFAISIFRSYSAFLLTHWADTPMDSPMRMGLSFAQSGLKVKVFLGKSTMTVEPSEKYPISSPLLRFSAYL
jgi:hypothetical protein